MSVIRRTPDEWAALRAEVEALTILAGANENTMRQWEGEANALRQQLRGAVDREAELLRAFDQIDSAMHELDDADALDAIVGIVNQARGQ